MKVMGNKSFNNATSGEDLGLEIVIPLYSTIFMLAVIGNTLVIVTLSRNRRMRTVTNIFLLNLAIADLLLGVFCMPFTLVGQALQNFIFGQLMCNLIPFFQASAVSSSVWTLVAISLERYFAICKPLRSRSWQTKSHAYKSIVAIWFGSFLFCLPIGLLAELQPISETGRHKCREVWPSLLAEKSYNLLLIVLFLVLPLILMGFAYSLIVYQLKLAMKLTITEPICEADIKIRVNSCENSRSFSENKNMEHKICARNLTQNTDCASATSITKEMRCLDHIRSCPSYCCPKSQNPFLNARNSLSESPPTKKSQVENNFRGSVRKSYSDRNITAKKKVIIMLCAIVIEFFVCWMPLSVINTWVVFDANGLYQKLSPTWISLIQLLAYLSSCCNPVTYGFLNLQFRTGFLNVFGCQSNRKDPRNIPLHPPVFIASPSGKRINKKKSLFRKIYQCSSTSTQSSSEV